MLRRLFTPNGQLALRLREILTLSLGLSLSLTLKLIWNSFINMDTDNGTACEQVSTFVKFCSTKHYFFYNSSNTSKSPCHRAIGKIV